MTLDRRVLAVLMATLLAISACATGAAPNADPSVIAAPPVDELPERDTAGGVTAGGEDRPAPTRVGPTDPEEVVTFQVVLRVRRAELDRFLQDVSDPRSPEYGRFLTADRFAARFGSPQDDVDAVTAWLNAGGIDVVGADGGRTTVTARATVASVNRFFGVQLVDYEDATVGRYHVPDGEPSIPDSVEHAVLGVTGLDTSPRVQPMFVPPVIADVPVGGLRQRDAAIAYDYAPLHDAGIRGEGQTVAIVSFDTFLESDVEAFDRELGITGPPVEKRPVPEDFVPVIGSGTTEVNLDIDVIRSIAPAAQIIDYEGAREEGFVPVLNAILDDQRADIVSISWGGCEIDYPPLLRIIIDTQLDRAFAQGISVFAASGDTGAFSCAHQRDEADERLSTVYPSVSPSVISVGGTFLWVREDGSYLREAAWEWSLRKVATGGGPSIEYQRPAWQVAAGLEPGDLRMTPDVAGPADPESGYVMVHTPVGATEPQIGTASGTSAAAPFWAGSMVLVRQLAEQQDVGPLGALGPRLYELAATPTDPPIFHDVTLGGNLLDPAGPGWDSSTGLGSPDVTALANAIIESLR